MQNFLNLALLWHSYSQHALALGLIILYLVNLSHMLTLSLLYHQHLLSYIQIWMPSSSCSHTIILMFTLTRILFVGKPYFTSLLQRTCYSTFTRIHTILNQPIHVLKFLFAQDHVCSHCSHTCKFSHLLWIVTNCNQTSTPHTTRLLHVRVNLTLDFII